MSAIEVESVDALVKRYAEAAAEHGRATEAGNYKEANRAYKVIAAVYMELRRRGREAQLALLPLLEAPEPGIRAWVGTHALEFSPADGERVLSHMENTPRSLVSLSAQITLRQWREGKLRFP